MPASEPASVTSRPSRIHVAPSEMTISQCQRLNGSRSSRAGTCDSIHWPAAIKRAGYLSLGSVNPCRQEDSVAHSVEELFVGWNDRGERTAQGYLCVFHEKVR